MLITISVPDETTSILYTVMSEDKSYEKDPMPITFDMLVRVEQE